MLTSRLHERYHSLRSRSRTQQSASNIESQKDNMSRLDSLESMPQRPHLTKQRARRDSGRISVQTEITVSQEERRGNEEVIHFNHLPTTS